MICRIYRWGMEGQLDRNGAIQSPRLVRHLQHCRKCSAWLQAHQRLGKYLQTPPVSQVSPARLMRLQMQVQQRLSSETSAPSGAVKAGRTAVRLWPGVKTAEAIILWGIGVWGIYVYQSRPGGTGTKTADISRLMTNSIAWQSQIPRWATLSEQPIRTEVVNLAADARTAITFLKNCLPADAPNGSDVLPESN